MEFDVAVLGGGPGGYEAAIRCSQYHLKTVLVEADLLGGTCLNRGCIPTKALLQSAELYEAVCNAVAFGVTAEAVSFDFAKMAQRKNTLVSKLREGVAYLEKAHRVTVIKGFGKLTATNAITVGEEIITAEKIILATGSFPAKPQIPGIDGARVLTSNEVLSLNAAPESMTIIGGGVIGIEFATLFAMLGIPVTVVESMPSILPGVDADVVKLLTSVLRKKGVRIITNARVTGVRSTDCATVCCMVDNEEQTISADVCVACVGRSPATRDIGLEHLGIKTSRGFVEVDENLRTSISNIYAIGDVTGKIQLAHVASAQGLVAAANCAGRSEAMHYDIVPACIYTNPEIAYVGKNSRQLAEENVMFKTGIFHVAGNGRAMVMGAANGIVKIFSDGVTDKILGAQIMAPRATDMIAEIAAVMKCGGTAEQLASTIHPHPTVSETLMEAAHDVAGLSCHNVPRRN